MNANTTPKHPALQALDAAKAAMLADNLASMDLLARLDDLMAQAEEELDLSSE